MENKDEFINDFITVGKLREMLSKIAYLEKQLKSEIKEKIMEEIKS